METLKISANEIRNSLLSLSKEKTYDNFIKYLTSKDDAEIFSALSSLRSEQNEKIDLTCAEYLAEGRGCKKSETEAGNLCAKIVTYLEKRNEFPPEYAKACHMAASLLYDKANAFELNLGFAIDYDRRGAENGNSEECRKRYEKNTEFLKNLLPKKYPNEEMLYKAAAFILSDGDKRQVTDNYWNTLKEEAQKTERAYYTKYFAFTANSDVAEVRKAEEIIEKNKDFPDGSELYQKEQARKSRPSLTASGKARLEIFTKISVRYNEYEASLEALNKTRLACKRKEQFEEKLGTRSYEFWLNEEKVERALEVCRRKETYESIFGIQPLEFWENDAVFFKYMDAYELKEKYKNLLGENSWEFWLNGEAVSEKLSEYKEAQNKRKAKTMKNRKLKKILVRTFIFVLLILVLFFILSALTGFIANGSSILTHIISAVLSLVLSAVISLEFKKLM